MTRQETIFRHLSRLRRSCRRRRTAFCGLAALTAFAVFVTAFSILDLALHMPGFVCWLSWLLSVAIVTLGAAAAWLAFRRPVSDAALAVSVERTLPDTDNHLINAVQLTQRSSDAAPFVDELLSEVELSLDAVTARQLERPGPRRLLFAVLAAVGVAVAVLFLITPLGMKHVMARLFLPMAGVAPYTSTTLVSLSPGDANVLRGAPLKIKVEFGGVFPTAPEVVWRRGRGEIVRVPLLPPGSGIRTEAAPVSGHFRTQLEAVFHDSEYRVVGNDFKSSWHPIRVTSPPGLESWSVGVIPPAYTGLPSFVRTHTGEADTRIPVGAEIVLAGTGNCALRRVTLVQGEATLQDELLQGVVEFQARAQVSTTEPLILKLESDTGLQTSTALPLEFLPDAVPDVTVLDAGTRILAERNSQVPLTFRTADDYGVRRVGLERLLGDETGSELVAEAAPAAVSQRFAGRFLVDLASFQVPQGETLRFRVWAEDNGPQAVDRRGYSAIVRISVAVPEERRDARRAVAAAAEDRIQTLVKQQRANLISTRQLADLAVMNKDLAPARLREVQMAQSRIRDLAVEILADRAALGELAALLGGLVNHEMSEVLQVFDVVLRADAAELAALLGECATLETRILAALTGVPANLAREQLHQEKTDLFAALQKLVAGQRENLTATKALAAAKETGAGPWRDLATVEDALASDLILFTDHCLILVDERVEDDLAAQIRNVYDLLDTEQAYEKILDATVALQQRNEPRALQAQEEVLRLLLRALDLLNVWRTRNAERTVAAAGDVLENTREKLAELEAKQSEIVEVTRDLTARGVLDDEVREKLAAMDAEQKSMAAMIEKLAQDLYQFPELPVCNELNAMMHEIFEDVEQALDSENTPALEIAVQKEDSLLDAIRNTKERVEDVEMWLMDIPDNIVWNMESFDTDEFPDIPLVPLPDELEDIVGDLLDQAADIEAQSQDTTGNNIIADMEMGWAIMDGPMPSFAAKGKSGNARPNDNEMTGRSGAGREGQATGELVESHVKGLEGRATAPRRTRDPLQKGMVTEDEDSTLDARSTGGGKLGGQSETIGMFGKAPRRDLHMPAHGAASTRLRQETEALYATARLLYLGTGSLGTAARELRGVENAGESVRNFESLHRRVLRRLADTQVELSTGTVLPIPVVAADKTGGAVTADVDFDTIAEEYRDVVSGYYRSLSGP